MAAADVVDGREFGFAVDGAILTGERNIDHSWLDAVARVFLCAMSYDEFFNLLGRDKPLVMRQSDTLMSDMLEGPRFVYVDMTAGSANHTLMGTEDRSNDSNIGLCATYHEMHVCIGTLAGLANETTGILAMRVESITT